MPLNHDLPALRDYHKAKRLMWDPRDIVLTTDAQHWQALTPPERDILLRLCAMFIAGEEAVTCDLAPLMLALRATGGWLEEQMFITTQLFEEAKHVEFFDRWFGQVVGGAVDFGLYQGDAYRALFYAELPQALDRLLSDTSAEAQVEAVATYHMIVEGVLAETGYYAVGKSLGERGLMPGLVEGMRLIQRDEARHIAFGIALLDRLVGGEPRLAPVLEERLNHLLPLALDIIGEAFQPYGEAIPFGLVPAEFVEYAATQFSHRVNAVERRVLMRNA